MKTKEEPEWYHSGQRPDEAKLIEAVKLYDSGWTLAELGKKFHRSKSNMWSWINIFAPEIGHSPMKKKRTRTGKGKSKAKRQAGVTAPETTPQAVSSSKEESLEDKVKRLEE